MVTLFVEQRRGFAIEAVHPVDAVACSAEGALTILSGVDAITTFRSASKPFQLAAALSLLRASERARLTPADLALGSASHHGEPLHIAALTQLLRRLGVEERALLCGAHPPLHAASAAALIRERRAPTALHNNCAGKHAFMVAATRAQGLVSDYRADEHPLQQAVGQQVAAHCGGFVGTVIDGCGLPSFVLPLSAMAHGYAAIARALHGPADGVLEPLAQIGAALRMHPRLMSGSEGFDGWLMEHADVLAKVGAGGLLCLALPAQQLGIAIKIRSGSELVRPAATAALLMQALPSLLRDPLPARLRLVYNVVGREVGEMVTRFEAD